MYGLMHAFNHVHAYVSFRRHSLAIYVPFELRVTPRGHGPCLVQVPVVDVLDVLEHIVERHVYLGRIEVPPAVFDAPESPCLCPHVFFKDVRPCLHVAT